MNAKHENREFNFIQSKDITQILMSYQGIIYQSRLSS